MNIHLFLLEIWICTCFSHFFQIHKSVIKILEIFVFCSLSTTICSIWPNYSSSHQNIIISPPSKPRHLNETYSSLFLEWKFQHQQYYSKKKVIENFNFVNNEKLYFLLTHLFPQITHRFQKKKKTTSPRHITSHNFLLLFFVIIMHMFDHSTYTSQSLFSDMNNMSAVWFETRFSVLLELDAISKFYLTTSFGVICAASRN